jgi:DNA polymerase
MRGKFFTVGRAKAIVTYHPAYLLRNPAAKKDTWEDIQMLMREMGLPGK